MTEIAFIVTCEAILLNILHLLFYETNFDELTKFLQLISLSSVTNKPKTETPTFYWFLVYDSETKSIFFQSLMLPKTY